MKNPLLRRAASTLVWAQDKYTFTLSETGAINCNGQPYIFTDKPVRVAHPMEMSDDEVASWQRYFNSNGIKQPFIQIWEPVRRADQIKEDRYEGCILNINWLRDKDKHGIHFWGYHDYSEYHGYVCGFDLDECHLDYAFSGTDDICTLGKFTFGRFTRKVNHIVIMLDSMTIVGRIRKDDITVMERMPGFTLAQIMKFIDTATEAGATNVLAALMEYKHENYADFDPMDEFTLEW